MLHTCPTIPALLFAVLLASVRGEVIERREFRFRTTMRATAFAEEGVTITCPLNWPQLNYLVPDGTYVEKGTVITEFDRDGIERGLQELRLREQESKSDLARTLIGLHNREMSLRDELAKLEDDLAVYETKLAHLRVFPDADDVEIAKGRLQVARLELDAASEDFEKGKDRYKRGMISPAELDKYEKAFLERQAQCEYRVRMLAYTSRPAKPSSLKARELEIANVRLDIERVRNEIEENVHLSEIQRRGASARAKTRTQRVTDSEADLEKTVVYAPISGYVVHLPLLRQNANRTAQKMSKNSAYLRIPDTTTLALRGVIYEAERRFFHVGDPVEIRISARPDELLAGEMVSFGAMPHDRGEKEEERWRHDSDSGIMVYDVTIRPRERPEWLRVGLTTECELLASKPVSGPSVPASLVRTRNGEHFLSFDGVYKKVAGIMVDGHFVLSDPDLAGQEVDWAGEFPEQASAEAGSPRDGQSLRVSGELVPADTTDVVVGPIHGTQKVAWLIPEDTEVNEGDVVARLDAADTDEEIKKAKTELERAVSQLESEQEGQKRRSRENEFYLARAENLLAMAELALADLREPDTTPGLLSARLGVATAQIRLTFLERQLKRVEGRRVSAMSPSELAQLRRDRERAELQLEAARTRLQEAEKGADAVALCSAELRVQDARLNVLSMRKKLETDGARYNYGVRRGERHKRWRTERLAELQRRRENLVLKAPCPGLVRYSKVWSGGVWSKAHEGSMVGHRTVLMMIADIRRMYIRLEMPEHAFTKVETGMSVAVEILSLSDVTLTGVVSDVEFLFQQRRKKDTERGLYSSHEALGETVFFVRAEVDEQHGVKLKPGAVAEVVFPFGR